MRLITVHQGWRLRILGSAIVALFALVAAAVFILRQPPNPINASLDALAKIPLSERWAHPEMAKIRDQGATGLESLRQVLREKDSKRTRVLLWLAARSPAATNYFSNFPDPRKMEERRWAACQAITQLGPAARVLVPDLVDMLRNADVATGNQVTMALYAIGCDAGMLESLAEMLEQGGGGSARGQVTYMLESVKPPAPRTKRVLESALNDASPWVQEAAVTIIGRLKIVTPGILVRLKEMQSDGANKSLFFSATEALWALEKKKEDVWIPTVTLLENEVPDYHFKPFGGGSGGQSIDGPEGIYLKAASLWTKMELTAQEKQRALAVLTAFCEKSGRIFIRMMLLPGMVQLGLDLDRAAEVCQAGLAAPEDYYNLQAARLVVELCEKWHAAVARKVSVPGMLGHAELGVQVYGAQVYWNTDGEQRKADVILPVLLEALNAKKHQSYYYPGIQTAAFHVLTQMGSEGSMALPLLRELEKDVNPAVAKQAAQAREKITARLPSEPDSRAESFQRLAQPADVNHP